MISIKKNKSVLIIISVMFLVIVIILSTLKVLFFSPVDFEYKRLQKNEVFQAFEKQFPEVKKYKIGFKRYTIEYHAESNGSQIILAKNYYGTVYFACDGNQLDSEPVIEISTEEFKSLIQQETICTTDVYQAWKIQ